MTGVPVTVAVDAFTSDGEAAPGASSFEMTLKPHGMSQVGGLLARLDSGSRSSLIVRAAITFDVGAILAHLSTADNTTNDASYQEGFQFGF